MMRSTRLSHPYHPSQQPANSQKQGHLTSSWQTFLIPDLGNYGDLHCLQRSPAHGVKVILHLCYCGLCFVVHHCLVRFFLYPIPTVLLAFLWKDFLIHHVQCILISRSASRERNLRWPPPWAHPLDPLQRLGHWPLSLIQRALYVPPGAGLLSILTSTALMICCSPLPLLHKVVLKQTKNTLG